MTLAAKQVYSAASSSPIAQSLLASCGLSDDPTWLSIIGRAVTCMLVDEPDISSWRCNVDITAKLFHDFDTAFSGPALSAGCGVDCDDDHSEDGACLICGRGRGPHSGHICREGTRGSWQTTALPLPAQNIPGALAPARLQGINSQKCICLNRNNFFISRRTLFGSHLRTNCFRSSVSGIPYHASARYLPHRPRHDLCAPPSNACV